LSNLRSPRFSNFKKIHHIASVFLFTILVLIVLHIQPQNRPWWAILRFL
jgi:hypothetical protein